MSRSAYAQQRTLGHGIDFLSVKPDRRCTTMATTVSCPDMFGILLPVLVNINAIEISKYVDIH